MKEGDVVFDISYNTWNSICNMYFSLGSGSKKAYLQWFPFSKMEEEDKETVKSEDFYNEYISSGAFVLYPGAMLRSENYIQKGDGSFRDAFLISPILYLVLQCIGKEIAYRYVDQRPKGITAYYAGNYDELRPKYKQDYDTFFKHLNDSIDRYQYFIKTDVTNFFNNINLNLLMERIDRICNAEETKITQTQLYLYKELLGYCGAGRFPLIENSIASSYLATIVYMDAIDCALYGFIDEKVDDITEFEIVRYVDDMYIMFSAAKPLAYLKDTYNTIINEYSSLLKQYGLSLNVKKCGIKEAYEINEELKKSLYDEVFNGKKHEIEEHFSGSLKPFLEEIYDNLVEDGLDNPGYVSIIEKHFYDESIEFTPSEVYNYLIYENASELRNDAVTRLLVKIINWDLSFLSLDPKRLSVMIMKSGSDKAIKAMLNRLFKRHRADLWNSYDTTVAIAYLIQSEFQHIDLLNVLKERCSDLYEYYEYNCRREFTSALLNRTSSRLRRNICDDVKALILYFLYWVEKEKGNSLTAFAYFKTFFDRTSADLACNSGVRKTGKGKPDYRAYYKESEFRKLYSGIEKADETIAQAHDLRNANPLAHSSAGLLDKNSSTIDIRKSIRNLGRLMDQFIVDNGL